VSCAPPSPVRALGRSTLLALVGLGALAAPAGAAAVREFVVPPVDGVPTRPAGITAGPDGALWFAAAGTAQIGRTTTSGTTTLFSAREQLSTARQIAPPTTTGTTTVPTQTTTPAPTTTTTTEPPPPPTPTVPHRIATDAGGRLWFTDAAGGIGRITADGAVRRFAAPAAGATSGITRGPDGAAWFTMPDANLVVRVEEVDGGAAYRQYPLSGDRGPTEIVTGRDGSLWFLEPRANAVGRLAPDGLITHYAIPSAGADPRGIALGPDGEIWFTERARRKIAQITTFGVVTELPLPGTETQPGALASGPDGALWFTELAAARNSIGRITVQGAVSRYGLPSAGSGASDGIVRLGDALWYTRGADRVGRVTPLPEPVAGRSVNLEPLSGTVKVRLPGAKVYRTLPDVGALLPAGSRIDARAGRVRLTSAVGAGSPLTKTAEFRDGIFTFEQSTTARDGLVTATMVGRRENCTPARSAAPRALVHAKKQAKRRGRRLWGNGKGRYRIRGTRAAATVRGTHWGIEDTCSGSSVVKVRDGSVTVRNLVTGRDVVVRKGGRYVVRRPRR
jgi:virginiamycin B lyase